MHQPPAHFTGQNAAHIHQVFRQSGELIWAATNEGLYKISLSSSKFRTFLHKQSLRGIAPLDGQTLLINSYSGASLFHLDKMAAEPTGLVPTAGIDLHVLPDGNLLSGYEGSRLFKIDGKARKSSDFSTLIETGNINTAFFDKTTGQTWAGCYHGLFKFDPTDGLLHRFDKNEKLAKSSIRFFYRNTEGLWVCTNTGLYLLGREGNSVEHLGKSDGLPNEDLNFLHEDRDGVFWLALRGGGLVRWDRKSPPNAPGRLKTFGQNEGFYNDFIYSIVEDKHGFFWLPTNHGLIRFDKTSYFSNTYFIRDGLPEDEFNSYSHYQAPDGRIFLGGLNGLTVFQPSDFLTTRIKDAPLHITKLAIFDGATELLEDRTLQMAADGQIELDADDLFLEIELALLDYSEPAKNRYAYFIEGFDNRWNYLKDNALRISGLPPGAYVLRAKAQGSDGQWSANEVSVPLRVRHPFYMRWRFWAAALILTALAFFLFNRFRTRRLLERQQELEREVAARTETISRQSEELRALDRAKSEFFENITHELRTPLTLILTPAEMLKGSLKTPADRQNLELIRRNAEKMLNMVGQLLDIAKLESGAMLPQNAPGDAVVFSENLLGNFRLEAQRGQIALRFSCLLPKIEIWTDFQLLDRGLSNLISNALKFTPPGGVVQLSLEKNAASSTSEGFQTLPTFLIWKISDTGKGIAPKDLPHVFDRFFRGNDPTIGAEGTGIGLSLAHEIARVLGGNLSVESREGEGSVFEFWLPFVAAPAENLSGDRAGNVVQILEKNDPPIVPETLSPAFEKTEEAPPLLLLVEDNADLRAMLRGAFSEKYEIREAADGAEGMALALETVPDIVVADVMMPGMDGFEFAEKLKHDRRTSHVPLIFLTAKTAQESVMRGLEIGADAYMTKPFRMEELMLRTQKLLEKNQNLRIAWASENAFVPEKQGNAAAKTAGPAFPGPESEFLADLRKTILENLDNSELNGDLIGRKIGMSRMSLHRKLKALTGASTGDFIRDLRFGQATEMLASRKFQIAEVAHRTGFSTPAHFSTLFKEKFGVSPSDWLKNRAS